jgi:hypothetical protein
MATELKIEYDGRSGRFPRPVPFVGERCRPRLQILQNPADIIVWLSEQYVEHRRPKHSQDDRRRVPRD